MDLELNGKNAVITGGSKGIGRAIALALAAEGANIAICARNEPQLRKTESEIREKGVTAIAYTCDIGIHSDLDNFLDIVYQGFGKVDILVNNVSALANNDELSDWDASINIDLMSSVRATTKIVPWMIKDGGGNILFISSISGLEAGSPPAYAAAKAALISYSKTIAVSLAPKGIRVNTIAPGSIEFEGGVWAKTKESNASYYNYIQGKIPFGRLGKPEEIGNVAAFLLSNKASWVSGVCLPVDGCQHKGNS